MLDALLPAADAFEASLGRGEGAAAALQAAAAAAEAGAAATAAMRPRLGRASYLGDRVIGIQDGGATSGRDLAARACRAPHRLTLAGAALSQSIQSLSGRKLPSSTPISLAMSALSLAFIAAIRSRLASKS